MKQEKLLELENKINKEYNNIGGMVVRKDDQILYEKYFNDCNASSRFHVYSVSKSVLSILFGIAIDKGYIKSIDQKVLDFFPDYKIKKNENAIQNITLKHLLTMTASFKYKFAPYHFIKYFISEDKLKFSLNLLGGKDKIGEFKYIPFVAADILSGILINTTGQSVFDFATENLFTPLGITVERNIVLHNAKEQTAFNNSTNVSGWVTDSKGVNTGGWGLTLSPLDMAKTGQLYIDGGMWKGKQIVSPNWIHESTQEHSRWKEMNLLYGYLWWIIDEKEQACAAMGDSGNVIYFNKEKNMVISIASLSMQNARDRLGLIKEYIEPLF